MQLGTCTLTTLVEVLANLSGDCEAWGDVQAMPGHLAKVRTLATLWAHHGRMGMGSWVKMHWVLFTTSMSE